MHSPEPTTHYYCEWHTKYGGGMAVCCGCYPEECVKNREAKEEDLEKGFYKTCLSIDCPERTGGKCTARVPEMTWQEQFRMFYDDNENGGSSRWLVSPDTVKQFIKGLLRKI